MSDASLGQFTSGNEVPAKREHQQKHHITQWLKSHGAGVLWEEDNFWDHPTFSIEDAQTQHKPDLVVLIGGRCFVVEFKSGDSVGEVYDSLPQILRYWRNHVNSTQTYVAGETPLVVDAFLTATVHSRAGRLFPRYAEKKQDYLDMDDNRKLCADRLGQLPPAEYRMTEQHVRTMWRMVKELEPEIADSKDTPHVGSLLSDALSRPSDDPSPAVLWNRTDHNQNWEVFE